MEQAFHPRYVTPRSSGRALGALENSENVVALHTLGGCYQ